MFYINDYFFIGLRIKANYIEKVTPTQHPGPAAAGVITGVDFGKLVLRVS
jgi:hypothetical protein